MELRPSDTEKILCPCLTSLNSCEANEINKCYVVNNEEIINCEVKESVIKFATPGKNMKIDENSTIVVKQLPLPKKNEAIDIEKVRDYVYIKDMRSNKDQTDFGNSYNRDKYIKHNDVYRKII